MGKNKAISVIYDCFNKGKKRRPFVVVFFCAADWLAHEIVFSQPGFNDRLINTEPLNIVLYGLQSLFSCPSTGSSIRIFGKELFHLSNGRKSAFLNTDYKEIVTLWLLYLVEAKLGLELAANRANHTAQIAIVGGETINQVLPFSPARN